MGKKNGPSTEPWGTPVGCCFDLDISPYFESLTSEVRLQVDTWLYVQCVSVQLFSPDACKEKLRVDEIIYFLFLYKIIHLKISLMVFLLLVKLYFMVLYYYTGSHLIYSGLSLVALFPGRRCGKRELLKRLLPLFNSFAIFPINGHATWWQIPKATIYIKRDWVFLQFLEALSPWRYPVPWLALFSLSFCSPQPHCFTV